MTDARIGKYHLIAELGQGGMASVALAVVAGPAQSGFSKLLVMKRLRPNLAEDPDFVTMFMDEARIAARLNHPNIVQTNEVGEVDGDYFIAMEYLEGQPLSRILRKAAFSKAQQYLIVCDALAGLHYAHELTDYDGTPLEIVHRDVTPHNIFVTYEGQVKVVDFGIAKAANRNSETAFGVMKGKVRYMPPEQAMSEAVDRRADVFAAGVMLWDIATGKRLWADRDDLGVLRALVSGDIQSSPKSVAPDVPDAIDRICRKALAVRPADRYETAEQLRQDLEQYLADSGLLLEARRKLGPTIAELYAEKRQALRKLIERQLTEMRKVPPEEYKPVIINQETAGMSFSGASNPVSVAGARALEMSSVGTVTSSAMITAPRKTYVPRWIFAASAGAGVALLSFYEHRLHGRSELARTVAAAPTPPAPSAPADELHSITISLRVAAPDARLTLDGRAVPLPYLASVARDNQDHPVRVEAAGYEPLLATIRYSGDIAQEFTLERIDAGAPAAKPLTLTKVAALPFGGSRKGSDLPAMKSPSPPSPTEAAPPPPPSAPPHADPSAAPTRPKHQIDSNDPWSAPK